MSLELGGRADKSGNVYENGILAWKLIDLLYERVAHIEVEPLGDEGLGVEFVVTGKDGARAYYQCKASNGANDQWRPSDLNRYSVFESAKTHILRRDGNTYHFISPLSCGELSSLCERARTSPNVSVFSENQLTNASLRNWWGKCQRYFEEDERTSFILLQRCYFEQIPDSRMLVDNVTDRLLILFAADSAEMGEGILTALKNSLNEEKLWGRPITAPDAVRLMENRGYRLRMREHDARILPKIEELNRLYKDSFQPIGGSLFAREETDILLDRIHSGKSTLLLGKAGAGKSGCIQELIRKLEAEGVPYLALPLDKYQPERFSKKYGESLGLPDSPVRCMTTVFGGTPSVLILDQLDSLRWMNGAAAGALDVCKQMIREADSTNQSEGGRVVVLFACRKFDYETDPGIRGLFEKRKDNQSGWKTVEVGALSDERIRDIVGDIYNSISCKLRELLRTPSNLYVWTRLKNREKNQISSFRQLLENWWKEVLQSCRNSGANEERIDRCRDKLVLTMQLREQLILPYEVISDYDREVDLLASMGVLFKTGNRVSFVHQSFFDYFSIRNQIAQIYGDGKRLPEFYPEADRQTPDKRYQLLMLLQYLLEADPQTFLRECRHVLENDHIHYYFQCGVFDVIGQMDDPDDAVWALIRECLSDEKWRVYVLRTVFFGHPKFIQMLNRRIPDFTWWDEEGCSLLRSVMGCQTELAVGIIVQCGANRFPERELFDLLSADEDCGSPEGFALRLALVANNAALLSHDLGLYRMIERGLPEAVELLSVVVDADAAVRSTVSLPDGETLRRYAEQHAERIIEKLANHVTKKAAQETVSRHSWKNRWCGRDRTVSTEHGILTIVQAALSWLAGNKPEDFLRYLKDNASKTEFDAELNIHAVQNLPLSYSDEAVEWLISDFDKNAFENTSGEENMLSACQRVIERFSSRCSAESFTRLEQLIRAWKPPREEMRRTLEYRKREREEGYWDFDAAFWGELQFLLLPCLDQKRIDACSKELIEGLNRKFPYGVKRYDMDRIERAKFISSPIDGHRQALSDRSWLRLIDKVSACKEKWNRENWDKGTESSPRMFARSFFNAAQKEPLRFAELSLSFSDHVYEEFKENAVRACRSAEIPLELACEVIRKFCKHPSREMAVAISRTVEERASEEWPPDVIEMLSDIAVIHPDPKAGDMPVYSMSKDKETECNDLLQSASNCARGCALNAIASLVFERPEDGKRFESVIRISVNDPHPAVRFASMSCVHAYYHVDRGVAKALFNALLQRDPRILYLRETEELMLRFYAQDRERYRTALAEAFSSQSTEVRKKAVEVTTLLTPQDDWMPQKLLSLPLTKEEAEAAAVEAAYLIQDAEEYRPLGKRIALHMLAFGADGKEFLQLLEDKALDLCRDKGLIDRLLCSEDRVVSNRALNYLCETDGPITEYIGTIIKYVQERLTAGVYYFRMERLIKCIARAFQQGMEDAAIRRLCLEVWDELFMRFPLEMKDFSEKLA